jgi:hypothetical protein
MRNTNWFTLVSAGDPCQKCNNRALCASEQLACPAFAEFVIEGEPSIASTVPTKEIYARIYSGGNDARDDILDAQYRKVR